MVDSGIQEGHILLEPAIDKATSRCFLPNAAETDIADHVPSGGHGTRVAGAILYADDIRDEGTIECGVWIQNARVLNEQCRLPDEVLPPALLRDVVQHYHDGPRHTRIFNHSINADAPVGESTCPPGPLRSIALATNTIFWLSRASATCVHQTRRQKLVSLNFYQAASSTPTIWEKNAAVWPIRRKAFRLSPLDLSVTMCMRMPIGAVSPLGLESLLLFLAPALAYGIPLSQKSSSSGATTCGRQCRASVSAPGHVKECYPNLVRSTLRGGPAFDRDDVGTSYAAPKVARIAAHLQATLPEESSLLYRALIVQSARWPVWAVDLPPEEQTALIARIGYGIPDIERASSNTPYRTTFVTGGEQEIRQGGCHVYQVPIPNDIRRAGPEYNILVEVTLSYSAEPRRTRRTHRGYLSTWLDWMSNRKDESLEAFVSRAVRNEDPAIREGTSFGWMISGRSSDGQIADVRRSIGTVQKDWACVKSNALPEDFCIAVRGHKGWSKDPDNTASYTLAVTFEIVGEEIEIYDPLRTAVQELQAELGIGEVEAEIDVNE